MLAVGRWSILTGRQPWLNPLLLFCLLATLSSVTGCSTRFIRSRAERRIARRLDRLIGPADRYRVRVSRTKDAQLVAGRIRKIDIDGWNVQAGRQINLEWLHLEMRDVKYHAGPDEQLTVGSSELVIHLTEDSLNDYLRREHPDGPPRVTLNGGTVTLRSAIRLLGVPTPMETTGSLEVADHLQVNYRASEVHLADADPVPGIGPEYVERHLNPLLDVERLNLPLRLDAIEVHPGHLVVRGSALTQPFDPHTRHSTHRR